ncbi:MAG: c-type cytochrome [Kiritimatiellales bacterium]|nr:c-type cytochrome [Kiritimatiellales bacterium]
MNYPFWDVEMGYGILMALIAVVHVFVSHFAIGGGLYLVVTEQSARKHDDARWLGFVRRLSKFFVLTTVVFGALTGVGIWFIIGLLDPAATEVLIHNFVWAWATEWCFFIVEILAALLYYNGWDRMSARNHMMVGWIYFIAAWLSLAVIDGIIAFMLTPGGWLESGSFWAGFFNPTYWSSLVLRTGICIMLAGLYALMAASREKDASFKASLVRHSAGWGLVGLAVVAASMFWFLADIPATVMDTAAKAMPIPMAALGLMWQLALVLGAMLVLFGLVLPKAYHPLVGVAVMVLGLVWFGSYEWFRESIRKPYVISGYMYANATEVGKAEAYQADGLLAHMAYRTGDDGDDLFRHACRSCHTINGYNALKPLFDGMDRDYIDGAVMGTGKMLGNMPPFLGTKAEAGLIADHIYKQVDHRPVAEIHGLSGAALGRKVYELRCGSCHVPGGHGSNTESYADMEPGDLGDMLDMAADLGDRMPAFTGTSEERQALIEYLQILGKGGAQ